MGFLATCPYAPKSPRNRNGRVGVRPFAPRPKLMCGIAGFITVQPSDSSSIIERMTDTIRHRGPDDSGYYRDPWASLGFRRLSIIDVAGGHQPMANEDATHFIVYNGEIFNHADLRPALLQAGHRYTNRCDTETILHAYEQYGPECVLRLRGMFAFAIWDKNARKLFCARDRLGIKPFYYYWDGRMFAFACEIKALLAAPGHLCPNSRSRSCPNIWPSDTSATSAPCSAASAS